MSLNPDLIYLCRGADYFKATENLGFWPVGYENWASMKILFGRDWLTIDEAKEACLLYYDAVIMGRPFWVRWRNGDKPIPVDEAQRLIDKYLAKKRKKQL